MALTIDADPTSQTFNCYCTLGEANIYHQHKLHNSVWSTADDNDKIAALLWATRQMDTLTWKGVRTSGTQPHQFPRKGLSYWEYDDEEAHDYEVQDTSINSTSTYIEIASDTVPQDVKNATAELAFVLMGSDVTAPTGTEGFKRLKVDTIELEMNPKDRLSWLQDTVKNLCWRFLKNGSTFLNIPTQRVG